MLIGPDTTFIRKGSVLANRAGRAQTKTNFAAMKLFETKKENELQQTKRGLG